MNLPSFTLQGEYQRLSLLVSRRQCPNTYSVQRLAIQAVQAPKLLSAQGGPRGKWGCLTVEFRDSSEIQGALEALKAQEVWPRTPFSYLLPPSFLLVPSQVKDCSIL